MIKVPEFPGFPNGRLAQLVQSICLTSRGSGVRIPQRPQINLDILAMPGFYFVTVGSAALWCRGGGPW